MMLLAGLIWFAAAALMAWSGRRAARDPAPKHNPRLYYVAAALFAVVGLLQVIVAMRRGY